MDFNEKIRHLRSETIYGKTIDLYPFGMQHIDDVLTLRNQPEAKYFLTQEDDLTRERQRAWIEQYEKTTDEFGHVIKNKKQETVGISFCYNYTGDSIEIGRAAFDLNRLIGMPYAFETLYRTLDIVFDYLEIPTLTTIVKKDNLRLQKMYKRLNWTFKGTVTVRGNEYVDLEVKKGQSKHHDYSHMLDERQNKITI